MKSFICLIFFLILTTTAFTQRVTFYVSPQGSDHNPGTHLLPFSTPSKALQAAGLQKNKDVTIELRQGTYHLHKTLVLDAKNLTFKSLVIHPYQHEKVIWSGATPLKPKWIKKGKNSYQSRLPINDRIDRLFLNGKPLPMARFPNYDSSARVFSGSSEMALDAARIKSWKNPSNGYIHALHSGEWGGMHFQITGKTQEDKLIYEGGWQNNRPSPMHKKYKYVENIFEELDVSGEWFYDNNTQLLYLIAADETILDIANFEASKLTDLLQIKGTAEKPAANITLSGIEFRQNNRSFMLTREPLLRSDWTIYRGGAVFLEGTENIQIDHCTFTELGGNAIFMSNYNKNNRIKNNHIHHIGASAIAFVGNPKAVRSPAFRYELSVPWESMDYEPGPKNVDFPRYCTAENNLVHHIGLVEKQVAGVQIEMSSHITVQHNTIYQVPRAGINIGDGCWGGHLIAYNDVFQTVLETGDHGAFNSWGRDRFWSPDRSLIDSIVAAKPGIEFLDVQSTNILRNNRFQCEHGWDIDLDDGSTNYEIYNNLCLSGGLKLREGYHRKVYNNILVNNTFHPHVWLKNSDDLFKHNIVSNSYAPILITDWGSQIDSNLFLAKSSLVKSNKLGIDLHSQWGDPKFEHPSTGNFQVRSESLAFEIGFRNFEMNFGVTDTQLRKLADKPKLLPLLGLPNDVKSNQTIWLAGRFKSIETLGDQSAAGISEKKGALFLGLLPNSILSKTSLKVGDVIVKLGDEEIESAEDLLRTFESLKWMGGVMAKVVRNQQELELAIGFK